MNNADQDREAIKQLAADWRSGWLAGDVDLLLSLYADEPVLMPQDHSPITGKKAIRAIYEPLLKEFEFQSEGTLVEVEASGDLGYFWSSYTLTAKPKAGGHPIKSAGKSLFIVRRQPGGTWKISRIIDNSNGDTAN